MAICLQMSKLEKIQSKHIAVMENYVKYEFQFWTILDDTKFRNNVRYPSKTYMSQYNKNITYPRVGRVWGFGRWR